MTLGNLGNYVSLPLITFCLFYLDFGQGSSTFLKLRATSCVPINAKGYWFDTHF